MRRPPQPPWPGQGRPRRGCLRVGLAIAWGALGLTGCGRRPAAVDRAAGHDLRGEVVAVSAERRTLLVHHEEIPGYMPAMVMEFGAGAADLSLFREGQLISARMFEGSPGEFRLEGIRVRDDVKDRTVEAAARSLRQETLILGKRAFREVGESVLPFTLYDQDGAVVGFERFHGKRVVLNFIYTRCPVPTMCPAATARMALLQRLARERGVRDLQLLSISFDPAYDTPAVLKAYAAARGIDLSNFSFLTGPEDAVRDLLVQFGVVAEPGENILKHTLATVLIDGEGRVVHRVDGSSWDPEDFLRKM